MKCNKFTFYIFVLTFSKVIKFTNLFYFILINYCKNEKYFKFRYCLYIKKQNGVKNLIFYKVLNNKIINIVFK